jgi:hypothetical protein
VTGLLLLLALNEPANSQSSDLTTKVDYDTTCDIWIENTTAYPGTETWVTVWMANLEPVSGYRFFLEILPFGSSDIARFSQDDTGGCFIEGNPFPWVSCECLNENCTSVLTEGNGTIISPEPTYRLLFRIRTGVCCIPDLDTNRFALILIPVPFSTLYDRNGDPLPFDYSPPGKLFVWVSMPGDANGDSLVSVADAIFLVNYLFQGGVEPCVCEAADCNNDSALNTADIVYLINYLFAGGPAPLRGSVSCWHEDCWP